MVMIPDQSPATQTQVVRSAYAGIPESGAAPVEQATTFLSSDHHRKLRIAQGGGMRLDGPPPPTTSGEATYLQNAQNEFMPCRNCGVIPCQGMRYIFEGEIRFKCNTCGKQMKLGYIESEARVNQEEMQGWDRAHVNKGRLMREEDVQRQEQMKRDIDTVVRQGNPYIRSLRDESFVSGNFLQ